MEQRELALELVRKETSRGVSFLVTGHLPILGLAVDELRRRVLLAEKRGHFRGMRCVIAPVYYSDKAHLEVMPRDPEEAEISECQQEQVKEAAEGIYTHWVDVLNTTLEFTVGKHEQVMDVSDVDHLRENTLPLVSNATEGFTLMIAALREAGTVGLQGAAGDATHNVYRAEQIATAFGDQTADLNYGLTCWEAFHSTCEDEPDAPLN